MKKLYASFFVLIPGFILSACSLIQQPDAVVATDKESGEAESSQAGQQPGSPELKKTDTQGAIVVDVVPINLADPGEELIFEVSMNTHSIDLSMDLAELSSLSTDSGKTVQATLWDAERGGHHVSGRLSFPASVNGEPLLEGATLLTLKIVDVDSPQRIFTWELEE